MKRTGYNVRFVQNFGKFRQYYLNNIGVNPPASYGLCVNIGTVTFDE